MRIAMQRWRARTFGSSNLGGDTEILVILLAILGAHAFALTAVEGPQRHWNTETVASDVRRRRGWRVVALRRRRGRCLVRPGRLQRAFQRPATGCSSSAINEARDATSAVTARSTLWLRKARVRTGEDDHFSTMGEPEDPFRGGEEARQWRQGNRGEGEGKRGEQQYGAEGLRVTAVNPRCRGGGENGDGCRGGPSEGK
jgi:hypothetical protein